MATGSDFDNININGSAFMRKQWRYIASAVKGLKPIWEGTTFVQLLGTEDKTIASGLISGWTKGTVYLSPESGTTDDMIGITPPSGLENGTYITLRLKTGTHAITLKHNSGSTVYKFQLLGGLDYTLNSTDQRIMFMFKDNVWYEHMRSGNEDFHLVSDTDEPQFSNSWGFGSIPFTTSLYFWKDSNNIVHLEGAASKASVSSTSSVIFTLPSGYRPYITGNVRFPVITAITAGITYETGIILIDGATGQVTWVRYGSAPAAQPVQVQFDGINFRAQS